MDQQVNNTYICFFCPACRVLTLLTGGQGSPTALSSGHNHCMPNPLTTQGCGCSHMQGPDFAYWWSRVNDCTQKWAQLQQAARACKIEVMYTVIQSLTADGRERSLDYKISGFHVPPGCWDAKV
eukprot:GHUV01054362.1.p1 GENE.GHUV01054362.1~~GHUV01054362.1.p1  ORF type:complete len:124 (-),score=24.32 GHUV01054362.1:65-436(-)